MKCCQSLCSLPPPPPPPRDPSVWSAWVAYSCLGRFKVIVVFQWCEKHLFWGMWLSTSRLSTRTEWFWLPLRYSPTSCLVVSTCQSFHTMNRHVTLLYHHMHPPMSISSLVNIKNSVSPGRGQNLWKDCPWLILGLKRTSSTDIKFEETALDHYLVWKEFLASTLELVFDFDWN